MVDHKECSLLDEHIASNQRKVSLTCVVNGVEICDTIDPTMTLLHFLRDRLKLFGTKESCGECIILAIEADGAEILTVEGLAKDGRISILQEEFISEDALQCGFCTPGFLMSTRALLDRNPDPSEEEIKEALAGNLCRCTGYLPILKAVNATNTLVSLILAKMLKKR